MTIRKGETWGRPGTLPVDGVVVRTDAEARQLVTDARRHHSSLPTLGLLGGDLCRTVGGTGDEARLSTGGTELVCDVGSVLLDGHQHWFVAHLAAHHGWWRGRTLVAMNAAWLGAWNLGPKAHPGDGLIDTLDASVRRGQRRALRARLATGSHLPHPDLRAGRTAAVSWELERPLPVHLDGELVAEARSIVVHLEPEALTIIV